MPRYDDGGYREPREPGLLDRWLQAMPGWARPLILLLGLFAGYVLGPALFDMRPRVGAFFGAVIGVALPELLVLSIRVILTVLFAAGFFWLLWWVFLQP